jgi:plasmid stabilization system protein ParE
LELPIESIFRFLAPEAAALRELLIEVCIQRALEQFGEGRLRGEIDELYGRCPTF